MFGAGDPFSRRLRRAVWLQSSLLTTCKNRQSFETLSIRPQHWEFQYVLFQAKCWMAEHRERRIRVL